MRTNIRLSRRLDRKPRARRLQTLPVSVLRERNRAAAHARLAPARPPRRRISRRSPPASPAATRRRTPATGSTASTSSRSRRGQSVGGSGNPAAASEAEQDKRAADALRAAGRLALARLRPVACAAVSLTALRSEFPILERVAYLNAGTDGPVPRAAQEAVARELAAEVDEGRVMAHFERRFELQDELRSGYAELLGCRRRRPRAHAPARARGSARCSPGMEHRPRRRDRHLRPTSTPG